jgi:hypothetical protein
MLNYDAEKDADNRSMDTIIEVMHNTFVRYNIDNFTFIQKYFKYIIKNHTESRYRVSSGFECNDSSNINTTDLNGMLYITSQNYFQNIKLNCLTCYLYKYNIMTTMLKNTSETRRT